MKKIIVLLALVVTGLKVNAQVDTLFLGDRDPVYYYWDTNWWDYKEINHPEKNKPWAKRFFGVDCKAEFARYCYTDTSLRIIGIAVCLRYTIIKPHIHHSDSFYIKKTVPEYVRLFEVDSINDDMHLMAEGQWTHNMLPRHQIQTSVRHHNHDDFLPIYNIYFNEGGVTVNDSFYVSITGNNNYWRDDFSVYVTPPDDGWAYVDLVLTDYCDDYDTTMFPNPRHYKRKLHYIDSGWNYDVNQGITDTNWHAISRVRTTDTILNPTHQEWGTFMNIFPIIDTSAVVTPFIQCGQPFGLSLFYTNEGVASLSWSGGGDANYWQLSVCSDNCEPEEGSLSTWNTTMATVQNLDTAQWYTARVRSICLFDDSTCFSDWSDSIRFYVSGESIRIETVVDRYTYLMPNPASETVTVISSFRIGDVEVYTLDGRSVMKQQVDAISTTLDISTLAAGTYVVRIATNNGATTKKLVVK